MWGSMISLSADVGDVQGVGQRGGHWHSKCTFIVHSILVGPLFFLVLALAAIPCMRDVGSI